MSESFQKPKQLVLDITIYNRAAHFFTYLFLLFLVYDNTLQTLYFLFEMEPSSPPPLFFWRITGFDVLYSLLGY